MRELAGELGVPTADLPEGGYSLAALARSRGGDPEAVSAATGAPREAPGSRARLPTASG